MIRLENVSAFTAIQFTLEITSSRDRMPELRAPRDFRDSTEVESPVSQAIMPRNVATTISMKLPTAQASTASRKGIRKPTVAPVTKQDREMVYPVRITKMLPMLLRALSGTLSNTYSSSVPSG